MKQPMLVAVLAMLAFVAPAAAQGYGPGTLPPQEILGIVRDGGFDPLGQPLRRGPNYVLRAVDDSDREVSVVVNARSGDIISVTPVATASRVPPGGSMGPYERMAPGYVPPGSPGAYRSGPPVVDEDDDYFSPDSRPLRSTEIPPPAERQDGLLPPPPERFPQRAAPATPPKPKPVKRAAAAHPKSAPLPKPRPDSREPAAPSSADANTAPPASTDKPDEAAVPH